MRTSGDLTTRNPNTPPTDNSRPALPPNAFTPRTDAQARLTRRAGPHADRPLGLLPRLQVTGAMVDDSNARWVLRLPAPGNWNGRRAVPPAR